MKFLLSLLLCIPFWLSAQQTQVFSSNTLTQAKSNPGVGLNDGRGLILFGKLVAGDIIPRLYWFVKTSTATANDSSVVAPVDNIGRWILSPSAVIPTITRQERLAGTTNGSGVLTFNFSPAFATVPNVQVNSLNANVRDVIVTNVTTSSVTFTLSRRSDVIGLLPTYAAVSGATLQALITAQ